MGKTSDQNDQGGAAQVEVINKGVMSIEVRRKNRWMASELLTSVLRFRPNGLFNAVGDFVNKQVYDVI